MGIAWRYPRSVPAVFAQFPFLGLKSRVAIISIVVYCRKRVIRMKELTACAIALMLGSPSLSQSSCEPMGFSPVAFIASGQTVEDVALFDPVTGYYLEIADWELDGVFDVDEDLLIADLELGALSGAVIIVRPGVTLTVNHARFFRRTTATAMWTGIRLLPGATLIADGITICGANYGVDVRNSSTTASNFQIDGVYMSNDWFGNYVGVLVRPYPSAHPGSIQGIGMQGGALIAGAPGGATVSRAGVQIDGVGDPASGAGINIGVGATDQNVFDGFEYGIEIRNSVCEVQHNVIQNGNSINGNGVGIFSQASNNEPGSLEVHDNIIRTRIGISSLETQDIYIHDNSIATKLFDPSDDVAVGVLINIAEQNVRIESNEIKDFTEYGVYILDVRAFGGAFDIKDNTIRSSFDDAPQYDLTGINIDRSALFSSSTMPFVLNNFIDDVQRGVYLLDQPALVIGNTINFRYPSGSTKPAAGIVNVTGDGSTISANIIRGDCLACTDLNVRGIQNYDATHVTLSENRIHDCGYGILLNKNVWEGVPLCNEFYDCRRGIGLEELEYNPAAPTQLYGIGGVVGSDPNPTDNKWYPEATANRTHTGAVTVGTDIDWFSRGSPSEFSMPAFLNLGFSPLVSTTSSSPVPSLCLPYTTILTSDSSIVFASKREEFSYVLRSMRSLGAFQLPAGFLEAKYAYLLTMERHMIDGMLDSLRRQADAVAFECSEEENVASLFIKVADQRLDYLDTFYAIYLYHGEMLTSDYCGALTLDEKSDRIRARLGLSYPIPCFFETTESESKVSSPQPPEGMRLSARFVGSALHFISNSNVQCLEVYAVDGRMILVGCPEGRFATMGPIHTGSGVYVVHFHLQDRTVVRKVYKY